MVVAVEECRFDLAIKGYAPGGRTAELLKVAASSRGVVPNSSCRLDVE